MSIRLQRWVAAGLLVSLAAGCQSMYFNTMEKFGVHKRDIMVTRVKEARNSQTEAKQEFVSALEQFKSVVSVPGGDLQKKYDKLSAALQRSEKQAAAVRERIQAVEDVSEALFKEWRSELKQYRSESLRAASQQKLDATRVQYDQLIAAMKNAESKIDPVLAPLRDQVLFLKHNLNAKAIASLGEELVSVQTNVDVLIKDMESSIAEADKFITAMQAAEAG